jgi:ubiquinone/menaquinone biosynthesis C-methylase UbiE
VTGLVLSRIAGECEEYVGTDFSEEALRYVREQISKEEERYGHVRLLKRGADEFEGIGEGEYDLVILNSVTQYFPDAEYLMRVMKGAVRGVRGGGHIFIGDVRSLGLLEAYHTSVEMEKLGGERKVEY